MLIAPAGQQNELAALHRFSRLIENENASARARTHAEILCQLMAKSGLALV